MRAGWLLALCALGCTRSALPQPPTLPSSARAGEHDALDLQLRGLDATLRAEGLSAGPLRERGFLPPGGRAAFAIAIAPGQCAVFVALASSNMADLDAALYTAEGTALIEDDGISARPSLTFCAATQPISGYLTLHAYQGAGSFVAAQFTRPLRPDDDLRTATTDEVSALGQLAQTLHERGFEDAAPRVSLPLGDAQPVRMAVPVAKGECYTLAAEGSEGLAEVGIRLVDSAGGELANGVGEPSLAALQYCASERAELALEVVARRGHGIARIARFRAGQAVVGGARALWLGEPTPTPAAWAAAGAKGVVGESKPAPFTRTIELDQGAVVELAPMPASAACTRWEAQLRPGLSRATLRIESEQGELLAESDSKQMHACVEVCGASSRSRVTLLGRAGFGSLVLRATPLAGRKEQASCAACGDAPESAQVRCAASSGGR